MTKNSENQENLSDVLGQLRKKAGQQDGEVTIQDALDAFAGRLFGPLLLVPGLVILTPLGAVPSLPSLMAVVIVLVAGQALLGCNHPWVPGFIAKRSVDEQRFVAALDRFKPWARRIDRITAPRMRYLIAGPMKYGIAAACIVIALTLPPLELLPWAAFVPGLAISLLGLAVTAEDGLIGLFGMCAAAGTLGLAVWAVPS